MRLDAGTDWARSRETTAHARARDHLRLDIQGLRAIAVLAVVVYHGFPGVLPGGFAGVDIFFVISGYLIAGILLGEMERGEFSLVRFYERRVRRLFPALFVMLACVLFAGALILPPMQFEELGRTTLSTIFFVSNVDFFSMSDYFDSDAEFRPLLHTWSLAVEEQFYLVFPLFLLGLVTFARAHLRALLGVCAVISLLLCLWALERNTAGAFFLAPFRGYELLIGAVLAGLPFPAGLPRWVRHFVSLLGLAFVLASLALLNETIAFPGLAALAPCLGTAMVLFAGAGGASVGGRLISGPFFSFFGALSYSLYLWHWPVLVLGKSVLLTEPSAVQTAALLGMAVLAATASWRWIEQPFLRRRGAKRALALGGATMAAGALIAAGVFQAHGVPGRFNDRALAMFAAHDNYSPRRYECHNFLHRLAPYESNCQLGAANAAPHYAVWADSHGSTLAYELGQRLARRGEALIQLTGSGCPPALDYSRLDQPLCAAQNEIDLAGLLHDERIETVIIAVNFQAYPHEDWPEVFDGLSRALDALAAADKQIVLVYPIPVFPYDVPNALGQLVQHGQDPSAYAIPSEDHLDANQAPIALLDELRRRTGAEAVYPTEALCDGARCPAFSRRDGALYFNRDHLSLAGARRVAARVPL